MVNQRALFRYSQILVESPTVTCMGFSIEKQTESRVSQINFLRKNPVDLRKKLGCSEKMNTKRESNAVIEDTLNKVAKDLEEVRFR
jgi:hypothetical protein